MCGGGTGAQSGVRLRRRGAANLGVRGQRARELGPRDVSPRITQSDTVAPICPEPASPARNPDYYTVLSKIRCFTREYIYLLRFYLRNSYLELIELGSWYFFLVVGMLILFLVCFDYKHDKLMMTLTRLATIHVLSYCLTEIYLK